ncbi:MAG: DUF3098 domain-containing protein [Hymenobacteraceae bacterium]|nr:DUF3098 domain-containing protein [Hymenobacteraceae bacterium]
MFAFGPRNYRLMFVGLAVLAVGFFLMTLGKEPYGFDTISLTIGPVLLVVGFIIQFFAILVRNRPTGGTPDSTAPPRL